MKIIVVGCGLIGVTAAYFLARRGHEVRVVDRAEGPARDTSFANGALLTPSMADPWNAPGCWKVLAASLFRSDAALQLRIRAMPELVGWGLTFLRNSGAALFERNRRINFKLALHSLKVMEELRREVPIEYGRSAKGALRIFRDDASFRRAAAAAKAMAFEGLSSQALSATELVALEPALAPIEQQLAGAIHYDGDEVGDAHKFCVALAEQARRLGVEFYFRTEISGLEVRSGRVSAVLSEKERFVADRYVIAAGSFSVPLLRQAGVSLPVRPAKGYSITLDHAASHTSLNIPIVDDLLHAVVVPLEGAIRAAGTAEFAGFDREMRPERVQNLLAFVNAVLPQAKFDPAAAKPWCGLRPMSVDGIPIVGTTPLANLLVSTGHGHLGWTLAAGSAQLLGDLISGTSPAIDPASVALARFAV